MDNMQNPQDNEKSPVIKTAFELAMEKLSKEPLPDDTGTDEQHKNKGRKLAASFLRREKIDVKKELKAFSSKDRGAVLEGMQEVFLFNIVLPPSDKTKKESTRALEGLGIIHRNSDNVLAFCGQIDSLLSEYLAQRKKYYNHLKQQFQAQVSMLKATVESQGGQGVRIEPEHLPDFQKKWKEILSQIDEQYGSALSELKRKLASLD